MSSPRYDLASVAIYDPVAPNRNATRNVLYALGFREIDGFASLDDLKRAASSRDFDLIVAEASGGDDPICDFIGGLRRNVFGNNPFLVVVVTTWVAESAGVRAILDSGADDLLTRPYSTNVLGDRLRALVQARKSFVVTADYVGPDRRKDPGRELGTRLIPVANSLKMKAVDGLAGHEAQQAMLDAVAVARRDVSLERMRRSAFQIGVIAGFVKAQAEAAGNAGNVRKADLERIVQGAGTLATLAKAEEAEQAVKTCATLIDVAENALIGRDLVQNSQILVRLAVALQVALTPGRSEHEFHTELDETLERIRVRGRRA